MILALILVFIAGAAKACADTFMSDKKWEGSVFNNSNKFFYPVKWSWKNKYKEDLTTPKFFGSTNVFVMFTDMWHLSQFVMVQSLIAAMLCYSTIIHPFVDFVLLCGLFHTSFVLFYNKLLINSEH